MALVNGLITLLTDFGERDWFVASMKGVILSINPNVCLVDLSHQIAPYQITEAAYLLHSSYKNFPEGTVHVAVVDPGVGSNRRPLLMQTERYYFVGPDNGILTPIFKDERNVEIRQLENRQYQLASLGATFHGRDIFAPSAAWLTKGTSMAAFGRLVHDPIEIDWVQPSVKDGTIRGQIIYVDRFGNLITNIRVTHLGAVQSKPTQSRLQVRIGMHEIHGMMGNYSEGITGMPHAVINSNGMLEIFVKEARAADILGAGVGSLIEGTLGRD